MTLTRADIETMRSLQVQSMSDNSDKAIRARVKLIQFIAENKRGVVAFRDCLNAGAATLSRKEAA